jgi:DNA polymerase-1
MRLVIDFETVDPYLDTLGSGWVHGQIEVVGASIRREDWPRAVWYDAALYKQEIIDLINSSTHIIAHNLQYDVGILLMWGVDISKKYLIDTMVMAKIHNSIMPGYSLDNLAKKYLGVSKAKDELGESVIKHKLYKNSKGKEVNTKDVKKAHKYAITHMSELYEVDPEIVIKYANMDADITWHLYKFLSLKGISKYWMDTVSDIYRILLKQRKYGVRIDIQRVREVQEILYAKEIDMLTKLQGAADDPDFNPLSGPQVAELLYKYNVPYPLTAKGNPSIQKKWLDIQQSPVCKMILEYRRYNKARRDFCDSVLNAQELLPEDKKGRVYPEFRVFGACTGRFSCAKPNIQQIPKRDEEIGPLVRSMYIPDEGQTWYSLDFSQQEFRIFAHYADLFSRNCDIAQAFRADANKDFHEFTAELCGITRDQAKPINLGSLYGMGVDKMAAELGLPVEEATCLLRKYHANFTDVRKLSQVCSKTLTKDEYITTIGGRKLHLDPPAYADELVRYDERYVKTKDGVIRKQKVPVYEKKLVTFEYKGLNKLIQGSAADQIMKTMILVDKMGIPMLFSVHDELNLSLNNRVDAEKVKEIMERSLNLRVPMVTDIGEGNNWSEAK